MLGIYSCEALILDYVYRESISLPAALAGATPSFIDAYVNVIKNKLESNARASGNESSSGSDSSYREFLRNKPNFV